MPDDLTRDERDARLVLNSVLTPHMRRVVGAYKLRNPRPPGLPRREPDLPRR